MEGIIDGREANLKKGMEDLNKYMEVLKEGGIKLLQERPPNNNAATRIRNIRNYGRM